MNEYENSMLVFKYTTKQTETVYKIKSSVQFFKKFKGEKVNYSLCSPNI